VRQLDLARVTTLSYGDEPLEAWVRAQTGGRGADLFIEALSTGAPAQVTMDAMRSLRRGGVGVVIGGMAEPMNFDPVWFMCTGLSWLGSIWFTPGEGEEMAAMAAAGTLQLGHFEHRRFPLDRANEALAALTDRRGGGFDNVVVMP
jgi:alcohol dehydrogenase